MWNDGQEERTKQEDRESSSKEYRRIPEKGAKKETISFIDAKPGSATDSARSKDDQGLLIRASAGLSSIRNKLGR